MKSKMKKGFTLTELVIVIAVIAILAAVLIPTYTAIVRKANISADTQLCKNMNTALSAESDVENMQQVVDILEDAGYGIGKFNPTTEDYRFVWDATSNQILLLDENMKVVSHAKSYDTENWELWLTVKNSKEVITSKKVNFNYFLAYDYNGSIKITTLSSFATGDNTLNGNVTLETVKNGEATVSGNITGTLTVNAPNATINQYGTTDNVNVVAVSNNTFNVYGYVSKLTLTQGRVVTQQASYTSEVVIAGGNAKVENNSIIGKVSVSTGVTISNTNFDNTSGYVSVLPTGTTVENPENYTSQISNYAQLCAFRDAVNKGATYAGITVQLTSDIALEDGWTPIGNFARKTDVQSFAGTFDGNNKTISNLNNIGYSPINTFENSSTIPGKKEYTYGFFGVVSGATVKNVKLTGVNINIPTGATVYGDKVGALIGYSSGKLVVDNVTVSGSVSAYDGVGGIIGGAYSAKDQVAEFVDKAKKDPIMDIVLRNCVNNAQVTGCEKASGIIGYTKGFNILLEDCTNNGAISAGYAKKTENNGCYAAGMVIYGTTAQNIVLTNCVSAGNITVSYNFNDGEKSNKGVNHYTICNKNGDNYRYVTSKNNCNGTGTLTLNTVVVTENPEDTKAESSK